MGTNYPQPNNEDDFEAFCERFFRLLLKRDSLSLYGKRGERQFGIDIFDQFSIPPVVAIQCKHIESHKSVPPRVIKKEVEEVAGAPNPIDRFIICTTAKRSRKAQDAVVEINRSKQFTFQVEILFWDDVCRRLDEFPRIVAVGLTCDPSLLSPLTSLHGCVELRSLSGTAVATEEVALGEAGSSGFKELESAIEKRDLVIARYEFQKLGVPSDEESTAVRYAWLRLKGKLELLERDFSAAGDSFLAAFEVSPHSDQAKQNRVLGLQLKGEIEQACLLAQNYIADGLRTPTMLALLVQTAQTESDILQYQPLISDIIRTDENLLVSMIHRRIQNNEIAASRELAGIAESQFPDSPHVQFALAACSHHAAWSGTTAIELAEIFTAIEHYDLAMKFASEQKFDALKEEILVNRAIAKSILGLPDSVADFEAALSIDGIQIETVEKAVSHFLGRGDFENARKYKSHLSPGRHESDFLKAVIDCNDIDDSVFEAGICQLKYLAMVDWPRADGSLIQAVQQEIQKGRFDNARDIVNEIAHPREESEQVNFRWLTLNAWISHSEGDVSTSKQFMNNALSCNAVNPGVNFLRLAAGVLSKIGDPETALTVLELVVRPGLFDEDCKLMLDVAQQSRRDDVALRICRELRATKSETDKTRTLEIQLLSFYAPEQALELCEDFIRTSKRASYFRAWKNWTAALLRRPEDMVLESSLLPSASELSPKEAYLVAAPLMFVKRFSDAVTFLFDQLNLNFGTEHAHASYVANFLQLSDKLEFELRPAVFDSGCAALLRDDQGEQQWIGVDEILQDRDRGWFSPDEPIAKELLGKCIGDNVQLPTVFVPSTAVLVVEIQSKFLRVFQDCLERFQQRFPGSSVIQPVQVFRGQEFDPSLLIASLKSRQEHVRHCLSVYRNELCSLFLLSKQLGVNEWQTLRSLCSGESKFVRCVNLTPGSFERTVVQHDALECAVLDMSAICTLSHFRLWGLLSGITKLYVGRSTVELIRHWVDECRESKAAGCLLLSENDQPYILERSDEQSAVELAELESMLSNVEQRCQILSSGTAATLPMESREIQIKAIGYHNIESICVAIDQSIPLWTDDLLTGLVAEADFGVTRVWTQLAMSVITAQQFGNAIDGVIAKLCAANYTITIWRGSTLAAAAELAEWDSSRSPFRECINELRVTATSASPLLTTAITVDFLKRITGSDCPRLLRTGLIQAVFAAVKRNDVLLRIGEQIHAEFLLNPLIQRSLKIELGYYREHNILT